MGKRDFKPPIAEADIRAYEREWTRMMVTIWRENLMRLGIADTMALHDSLQGRTAYVEGQVEITHQFLLYGLYVARGTGNGYRRGNGGDLGFTPKRKRRDWFSRRYLSSINVLNEVEVSAYAGAYLGTVSSFVNQLFARDAATGSRGTDVSKTVQRF